jgi:CRP-like cAMP-binding protein
MLDSIPFLQAQSRQFIRQYNKSDVIFEEGTHGAEMYIICAGRIRLVTPSPGREVELATIGPGEFFGEMALVDSSPRSATAIADEDGTRLVALDQAKFLYLVSQQPAFALTIMHGLCRRIRERWVLYHRMQNGEGEKGEEQT